MNTKSIKLKKLWKLGHFDHLRKKLKLGFFRGRKHTEATKEKMRIAKLGKKRLFTALHRKHLSKALKGRKYTNGQKIKQIARSLFNVAVARGKIKKQVCEVCGEVKTEAHHDDYSKPLVVRWLCKKHHHELHKNHNYVHL